MTTPKKRVHLELVGLDGNSFNLLGCWRRQARREGWPLDEIDAVTAEATSGNYDHLLATLAEHCEPPVQDENEPMDTIDDRAALAVQAAERGLATVRRLLADPAVNAWSEDERISIHAGLTGLAEDAEELAGEVPGPIEDEPEAGGK